MCIRHICVRRMSFVAIAGLLVTAFILVQSPARAIPVCDPVTDEGWNVAATDEVAGLSDGAPYQEAGSRDWYVDRTTELLPTCSYFNPIGIYSMRSYTLDPETKTERIAICRATAGGASAPIAPYAGPCPPK